MCGIIGILGKKDAAKLTEKGLKVMDYRGKDAVGFYNKENVSIGHCLHSIVSFVQQPFVGKGVLAANCEIYNWKEIDEFKSKNDAEMLFNLVEKNGVEKAVEMLDGVYAFAYYNKGKVYLARDIIGIKPMWYSHKDGFAFASEKKALEKAGYVNINELNPRKILVYDVKSNKIELIEREFFKITPVLGESFNKIVDNVGLLLNEAIKKRLPERKFGILFSGGLDSTVMALMLKNLGHGFTCYTAVLDNPDLKEPEDLEYAKRIAHEYQLNLRVIKIKLPQVEKLLKKIVPLIEDYNVVKAGVAVTFYAALEQAKKDECKVIFSGLGSEEIFAGYQRHKEAADINKECVSGLLKMYERDTYRDDVISMYHNLELRLPYLDNELAKYSLRIPPKYKLHQGHEKYVLREVAKKLGLAEEYAMRPKKAAQYGSNFHKAISKLSRKHKYKYMSDYLRTLYPSHNVRLAALVSSGKDSIYAMHVMMKQNYPISCMITLKSKNPDSFMFHTPAVELVKLQSQSIGIPLLEQETEGEKEKELADLKKALKTAKEKYNIEGVVTGALFSNYQRERVEKICDALSLKIFSPLWHINQETLMREIIDSGFKFILTKVAAYGLDDSWLGKEITHKDIDKLVEMNKKVAINIAFEGGEAESLMIDGPIFKKRIEIKKGKKVMENECTGVFLVGDAVLE